MLSLRGDRWTLESLREWHLRATGRPRPGDFIHVLVRIIGHVWPSKLLFLPVLPVTRINRDRGTPSSEATLVVLALAGWQQCQWSKPLEKGSSTQAVGMAKRVEEYFDSRRSSTGVSTAGPTSSD